MQIKDFILEQPKFLSSNVCQQIIDYYHDMEKMGAVRSRVLGHNKKGHEVSDNSMDVINEDVVKLFKTQELFQLFSSQFWNVSYPAYVEKFSLLSTFQHHQIYTLRIQKSSIGDGYHTWHAETMMREFMERILTFIVYLNDVNEGGETEFLYYPRRVKPEEGKLVLFPGSFTHAHRGNQPLSNEKYILTGWVEF